MKYLSLSLLTVFVLTTSGCDFLSDDLAFFFSSSGESSGHGASASDDDTSDGATLVISSLP